MAQLARGAKTAFLYNLGEAMPDPDATFDALAQRLLAEPGVEQGTVFRSRGLKRGGKNFALFVRGRLVLKLPAERCTELVEAGAERFESGGRVMREWASIGPGEQEDWLALAEEALAFNRSSAP